MKMHLDSLLSLTAGVLAILIMILYLTIPESASAEYAYTIEVAFEFCFLPLCLGAIVLNRPIRQFVALHRNNPYNALIMGIAGIILVAIPLASPAAVYLSPFMKGLLSVCWILGSLSLALCAFLIAAKISNVFSGLLCLAASVILFCGLAEIFYFLTDQYQDTYVQNNEKSKYVRNGQAQAELVLKKYDKWLYPEKPKHPSGAAAHREDYKNRPLFDVRYIFDDKNRRTMPPVSEKPGADILLFGCSYTFGYGLENEQTWAWKLSRDLGPDWKITNYGFSAYGAQEMLDMLEDGFVEKPSAPFREALFLAISAHLHRPTGLFDMFSSRYVLRDGIAVRDGVITESPYYLLNSLPRMLNGSQAFREVSGRLNRYFQKTKRDHFLKIYLSLIEQSARILKEKYNTPLTVLVWPDLDEIIPTLEKMGISAFVMRKILPEWDDPHGSNYHIVKNSEFHPNDLATGEIAAGLAAYLRELRKERSQ